MRCTRRLKVVGHGGWEHERVGPLRNNARSAFHSLWIECGRGGDVFKHITDQVGVAINISPDLHERGSTMPPR